MLSLTLVYESISSLRNDVASLILQYPCDFLGATSGIGLETTRVLALRGVHVIMAVRNVEVGQKVKASICEKIPNAKLDVMELDLSSQASVHQFSSDYITKDLPLNILMYKIIL